MEHLAAFWVWWVFSKQKMVGKNVAVDISAVRLVWIFKIPQMRRAIWSFTQKPLRIRVMGPL